MFNSGQCTIWKKHACDYSRTKGLPAKILIWQNYGSNTKHSKQWSGSTYEDLYLNMSFNNGLSFILVLALAFQLKLWARPQILKWECEHTWFLSRCSSIVEGLAGYNKPTCVNSIFHVLISVPLSGNQSTLNTLRNDDWTPFSQSDSKCSITSPELPIHQITSHKAAFVWSVPRSYNSLM